jgi:hypothetical protein
MLDRFCRRHARLLFLMVSFHEVRQIALYLVGQIFFAETFEQYFLA